MRTMRKTCRICLAKLNTPKQQTKAGRPSTAHERCRQVVAEHITGRRFTREPRQVEAPSPPQSTVAAGNRQPCEFCARAHADGAERTACHQRAARAAQDVSGWRR